MTEVATEATEAPEATGPVFDSPEAEVSFKMINTLIVDRNGKVGKINAVKGDHQTLREQLTENSELPDAVEARARRDQAQEALDQAVLDLHKAVQPEIEAVVADSEGAAKALEEEVKELDGKIKPAMTFFRKMFGEDLTKHLAGLERLKGFSSKGSTAGGRRVRGYNAVVTIDGESTQYDNLASAAKYLGLETADLQKAFFEAAGNPEQVKDAPDKVSFSVTFSETYEDGTTNEKSASILCERTAKEEAETEDSDEAAEVEVSDTETVSDDVSTELFSTPGQEL